MRKEKTFRNPILSGFYPDPSICRVDEDYYMVTSSFVYFPGLPIFHSRDLVHWEQIGHCIHRREQLDYRNCETSLGLWAPTIRYHEGTFYVVNTFVSEGREARRDNYIITAKNPAGPWSDPVFVDGADGIDPSLFFDEDGRMWYTGNFISKERLYEGHHGIYLCELEPENFQFKGERYIIWDGKWSRGKWLEAPHIHKINGWYYLMAAEGGTFTNHSVMMARSRTITGKYEICPRNPVVSHRHLSLMNDISVVGHADIVETQKGEWWMVLLGVRHYAGKYPYGGPQFNLGRETFLIPISWQEDGWPIIDNENGLVNEREVLPDLPVKTFPMESSGDNFEELKLRMMWNTIHPSVEPFYSLKEREGYLRIFLRKEVMEEICTPSFIGRRQQHRTFLIETAMEFLPENGQEEAGISIVQDDRFHYSLLKSMEEGKCVLRLSKTENGRHSLIEKIEILGGRIYLSLQGDETGYQFYYGYHEGERIEVGGRLAPEILSSNVNGGFTGAYIGMYTTSNQHESCNYADYDWFMYSGKEM